MYYSEHIVLWHPMALKYFDSKTSWCWPLLVCLANEELLYVAPFSAPFEYEYTMLNSNSSHRTCRRPRIRLYSILEIMPKTVVVCPTSIVDAMLAPL